MLLWNLWLWLKSDRKLRRHSEGLPEESIKIFYRFYIFIFGLSRSLAMTGRILFRHSEGLPRRIYRIFVDSSLRLSNDKDFRFFALQAKLAMTGGRGLPRSLTLARNDDRHRLLRLISEVRNDGK